MSAQQAAFFFGSGVSIPSGMSSVKDITDSAKSGDWHFHTDQCFYPGTLSAQGIIPDLVTPLVKEFLLKVEECAADYLSNPARQLASPPRAPHYEDLFSLAEQASRQEIDYVPNLAVVEFLRRLKKMTETLHGGFKNGTNGLHGFTGLAGTACDFLHAVVHHNLSKSSVKRTGLDVLSDVAANVKALDIFTLNHDLLVEEQLAAGGISDLETGFDDESHGEFKVYRSGWIGGPRKKARLFKLHGSLNWYLFDFPGWARQYAIPNKADYQHCHDQNGRLVTPVEWKAAFLSGTVVKEQRYSSGVFGELFAGFRTHLAAHQTLICCGYGFGDPGVNQRIYQWACDQLDGSNTIVVLSPQDPSDYLSDKPYWMTHLHESGQLKFVRKYLQHCSLADLEPYFDAFTL